MSTASRLQKRYMKELRFKLCGLLAIVFSLFCLAFLLGSVFMRALPAFTAVSLELNIPVQELKQRGEAAVFERLQFDSNYSNDQLVPLLAPNYRMQLAQLLDDLEESDETQYAVRLGLSEEPLNWLRSARDKQDQSTLSLEQKAWLIEAEAQGVLVKHLRYQLFSNANSSSPILAGFWGALKGSLLALAVAIVVAFPIGISAAIYLEEFAPNNKVVALVELNINNLAAVPSIIFGLLGLGVYISWLDFPRAIPLVIGLVLALMMLPVVIITCRSALYSVSGAVRMAAVGIGASPQQVVIHHVLPIAMPRMLTGLILSVGQVMGETAPMLLIGTVAFFADVPSGLFDPSTVLPVQIYMWAGGADAGFAEVASASIVVLLGLLILVNVLAAVFRYVIERRNKGFM